jgi:hypothetical protein
VQIVDLADDPRPFVLLFLSAWGHLHTIEIMMMMVVMVVVMVVVVVVVVVVR